MKLKLLCVLIVVGLVCSNVKADDDDDESQVCLETYLRQKGKLGSDFPARQPSPLCIFITPISLKIFEAVVENQIRDKISNNTDCLIREFKNQESLDLIVKLGVIEDSELSESKMRIQKSLTRNELRQDLIKIALQCETDENSFIPVFNEYFGIKNVTLSAMEHNYCFAKYAADHELLPLENVDINPNGIDTTHIKCKAIIRKEHRRQESRVRDRLKEKKRKTKNCVMEAYRNNNIFEYGIMSQVLEYLEFSKEIKDAEANKIAEKIADYSVTIFTCLLGQ